MTVSHGIKLVLFDALHTLITPRLPIQVQYTQVFEPHLGKLDPDRVHLSFKRDIQCQKPVYRGGAEGWWGEVIKRTAVGAGADPRLVDVSLPTIVPRLMQRFSGKEAYKAFDDVIPTLHALRNAGIRTGLVSNTDLRLKTVLADLGLAEYLDPILISEQEGIEKPSSEIWERACSRVGVKLAETLHVGDELECDYYGAIRAGTQAVWLRRPNSDSESDTGQNFAGVAFVRELSEVLAWALQKDQTH